MCVCVCVCVCDLSQAIEVQTVKVYIPIQIGLQLFFLPEQVTIFLQTQCYITCRPHSAKLAKYLDVALLVSGPQN